MKNKSGFISMSLVYSFLIIFMFLMTAIIECYAQKNNFLQSINNKVNEDLGITKKNKKSLFNAIVGDNTILSAGDININKISSKSNGRGLYYIDDVFAIDEDNDNNTNDGIYFFRGKVINNYVVFGTEKIDNTKYNDICWKILRTNEDGSIRLVYYGNYNDTKDECESKNGIKVSPYNVLSDDNAYVGYTYGIPNSDSYYSTHYGTSNICSNLNTEDSITSIDSTIKSEVESWLDNTNLYNELVKDGNKTFSALRKYMDNGIYNNERSRNSGTGFKKEATRYKLSSIKDGIFDQTYKINMDGSALAECSIANYDATAKDRYSLNEVYGGYNTNLYSGLNYSIGLLTVNDVIFAGGKYDVANDDYFLKENYSYWTMSPDEYNNGAYVFAVNSEGKITSQLVNSNNTYIRPVISINSLSLVESGTGLKNDPYYINEIN